jgi:hypothetical protein
MAYVYGTNIPLSALSMIPASKKRELLERIETDVRAKDSRGANDALFSIAFWTMRDPETGEWGRGQGNPNVSKVHSGEWEVTAEMDSDDSWAEQHTNSSNDVYVQHPGSKADTGGGTESAADIAARAVTWEDGKGVFVGGESIGSWGGLAHTEQGEGSQYFDPAYSGGGIGDPGGIDKPDAGVKGGVPINAVVSGGYTIDDLGGLLGGSPSPSPGPGGPGIGPGGGGTGYPFEGVNLGVGFPKFSKGYLRSFPDSPEYGGDVDAESLLSYTPEWAGRDSSNWGILDPRAYGPPQQVMPWIGPLGQAPLAFRRGKTEIPEGGFGHDTRMGQFDWKNLEEGGRVVPPLGTTAWKPTPYSASEIANWQRFNQGLLAPPISFGGQTADQLAQFGLGTSGLLGAGQSMAYDPQGRQIYSRTIS